MHDRKTFSLAAELRRSLRAEFPAVARLSVTDPDFMEALLDYATRSTSSAAQAAALTLRTRLEGAGHTQPSQGSTEANVRSEPDLTGRPKRQRIYRGRVIRDDPQDAE